MRRAVIASGIVVFVALAPSVLAQQAKKVINVTLISPAPGQVLQGLNRIEGKAESSAGVKRIELRVQDRIVADFEPPEFQQEASIYFDWDTRFLPHSNRETRNRYFTIEVRALASGERVSDSEIVRVAVDNPPLPPTGLQAYVEGRSVLLGWDRNPEPDVTGYRVLRASEGRYRVVGSPTGSEFHETLPVGSYLYAVIATRSSTTSKSGVSSPRSAPLYLEIEPGADPDAGFIVGGAPAAPGGLPNAVGVQGLGQRGLPRLPAFAADEGSYRERLPYRVPKEFRVVRDTAGEGRPWWRFVPPDGLRWVAAGALLLVMAGQARFLAGRLTVPGTDAR